MTKQYDFDSENPFVWHGILDSTQVVDDVVASGHRVADAAKGGDWAGVFAVLDDAAQTVDVNWWRPGGTAWFSPLHQAAWHGAPVDVAAELVRRGALRSLADSHGRTAFDVRVDRDAKGVAAQQQKSLVLRSFLTPPPSPLSADRIHALDTHLAEVIDGRIRGTIYENRNPLRALRYPPVDILHEVPGQRLWFPVPGMYGGFDITLRQGHLDVRSWCRVVGGSGQAHLVTHEGAVLVDEGFV